MIFRALFAFAFASNLPIGNSAAYNFSNPNNGNSSDWKNMTNYYSSD